MTTPWSAGTGLLSGGPGTQDRDTRAWRVDGRGGMGLPQCPGPLPPAGISQQNQGLHPRLLSTPHRELLPGPDGHTNTGPRGPTLRDSNTQTRGAAHQARTEVLAARTPRQPGREASVWTRSLATPLGLWVHSSQRAPSCPLTMMASACLASSSETALRKPLACGVAVLGVGMTPARSGALFHSPLPGGLL